MSTGHRRTQAEVEGRMVIHQDRQVHRGRRGRDPCLDLLHSRLALKQLREVDRHRKSNIIQIEIVSKSKGTGKVNAKDRDGGMRGGMEIGMEDGNDEVIE